MRNGRHLVEQDIIDLISAQGGGEMFYGHLLSFLRVYETTTLPTAGVNVKDGYCNLYVNPDFWRGLGTARARRAILKHECLHLLHSHVDRLAWSVEANIAADVAINQLIPESDAIPKDVRWTPAQLSEALGGAEVLGGQATEYYYELIKKEQAKGRGKGGLGDNTDDHKVWGEGDQSEAAVEAVKRAVRQAKQAAGTVPGELSKLIEELYKGGLDWRSLLRRFVANAEEFVSRSTRHRRNRRYGTQYPGWISEPRLNLAVVTDSSGSVSDEAYGAFIAEIEQIARTGAVITWMQADAVVNSVEKWRPKKGAKERKGYGGTAYGPALAKARELKADAVVYFGDMDSADRPENPRIPVLWAVVGEQNPPASFGTVVRVRT